ncbi:MAG TPA: hypothetical protein VFZ18_03755, partial [Longimicrobiaceae bacterium]
YITGMGVMAIGAMLVAAAFFTGSSTGLMIDLVAGAALLACGWILYRTRSRPSHGVAADEAVAVAKPAL